MRAAVIETRLIQILFLSLLTAEAWAQSRPTLPVPLLERAPTLDDFPKLEPNEFGRRMGHASGFIQQLPTDGASATERTEAYFGYDQHNIYAVLLCFDSQPEAIRANLTRRENAFDDDWVEVIFDTFRDERHGFIFLVNPLGVQHDGLWTENASSGDGTDFTFDTVWKSQGRLTGNGYVVLIAVPFRSLRFSPNGTQAWGMTLLRSIARKNERVFWPRVSLKINGRMNQAATITGMEHVSPGRNLQFIPYGILCSYRALDERGAAPRFEIGRAHV